MKFFKKIKKAVKKIESVGKKLKQKIKNDRKLKKVRKVAKIVLPNVSPFFPTLVPFVNAIPFLGGIPNVNTNGIIAGGINLLKRK